MVPIDKLIHFDEWTLFKSIISSADRFPGLDRSSPSWKQSIVEERYLKWLPFIEVVLLSQKNKKWTREQWFEAQDHIFNLSFGKGSRNEQISEMSIKEILKEKALNRYKSPSSFRLAIIDPESEVFEIKCGRTYFMMGSLIRFEEQTVKIGYDQVAKDSYLDLNISFKKAEEYIASTLSEDSINDLFLKSEVVAHLKFGDSNQGELEYDNDYIQNQFGYFQPNAPIFASPIYKTNLPIQYSKPIGVTNVGKIFG